MQGVLKRVLVTLAWSGVVWPASENSAALSCYGDAWNTMLKGVKGPPRMFCELNVFAVIL